MSDYYQWTEESGGKHPLFSNDGEHRKDAGMQRAAENNPTGLELAKTIARELALQHGETDADQVGALLFERHKIQTLGPAAGSIFKGGEWEFTGKRKLSRRKSNHAREIKVWRLKAFVMSDEMREEGGL